MEAIDNTPGKVLMRNWVDSRFNLAEWSMPILMTMLVFVLVVSLVVTALVEPATYATWAFMILIAVDITRMWRGFKKSWPRSGFRRSRAACSTTASTARCRCAGCGCRVRWSSATRSDVLVLGFRTGPGRRRCRRARTGRVVRLAGRRRGISAHFAELSEAGVRAVSLYEEDRLVYGPMSLGPSRRPDPATDRASTVRSSGVGVHRRRLRLRPCAVHRATTPARRR